jgi:hypothetical protein
MRRCCALSFRPHGIELASRLSEAQVRLFTHGGDSQSLDSLQHEGHRGCKATAWHWTCGRRRWRTDRRQLELPAEEVVDASQAYGRSSTTGPSRISRPLAPPPELLEAVSTIWAKPFGWPVFIEQRTDVGGCARPLALTSPLHRTIAHLPDAPRCLKEALAPVFEHAMSTVAESSCFCQGKEEAAKDLQVLASAYQASELAKGKSTAATRARVGDDTVRFKCQATN